MDGESIPKETDARNFAEFFEPIAFYNAIDTRSEEKPIFLRRSAIYGATHGQRKKPALSSRGRSYVVKVGSAARTQPTTPSAGIQSFVVALATQRTPTAWLIRRACLLHVPLRSTGEDISLEATILQESEDGTQEKTSILLLSRQCHPDLTLLNKPSGSSLCCRVTSSQACGMLPVGSTVHWCAVKPGTKGIMQLSAGKLGVCCGKDADEQAASLLVLEDAGPAELQVLLQTQAVRATEQPPESQAGEPRDSSLQGSVFFRYLYDGDRRYHTERRCRFSCPLCKMRCQNLWGLRQHMEATHSQLDFTFAEDHPDVLPTVDVRCRKNRRAGDESPPVQTSERRKVLSYYCPPRLRQARERQYDMPLKARKALPGYLTTVPREAVQEEVVAPGRPPLQARKRTREVKEVREAVWDESVPRLAPDVWSRAFYHARSHMPMLEAEVQAILDDPTSLPDSDDEQDLTEWKERSRRRLREHSELSSAEREFMFNWNLHVQHHPMHADLQVPEACKRFSEVNAAVLTNNPELRKCFVAHMLTLWDYGLVDPETIDECMKMLEASRHTGTAAPAAPP